MSQEKSATGATAEDLCFEFAEQKDEVRQYVQQTVSREPAPIRPHHLQVRMYS